MCECLERNSFFCRYYSEMDVSNNKSIDEYLGITAFDILLSLALLILFTERHSWHVFSLFLLQYVKHHLDFLLFVLSIWK